MSDTPTSNLRRIRTFAEDVRSTRGQTEQVVSQKPISDLKVPSTPSPVTASASPEAAPVRSFAEVPMQSEHIPSFHELQKKPTSAPTPVLKSAAANSTMSHTPTVTVRAKTPETRQKPITGGGGATIITDRSTNKVGFIGGIVQAFPKRKFLLTLSQM
jgi:hypothetical protein